MNYKDFYDALSYSEQLDHDAYRREQDSDMSLSRSGVRKNDENEGNYDSADFPAGGTSAQDPAHKAEDRRKTSLFSSSPQYSVERSFSGSKGQSVARSKRLCDISADLISEIDQLERGSSRIQRFQPEGAQVCDQRVPSGPRGGRAAQPPQSIESPQSSEQEEQKVRQERIRLRLEQAKRLRARAQREILGGSEEACTQKALAAGKLGEFRQRQIRGGEGGEAAGGGGADIYYQTREEEEQQPLYNYSPLQYARPPSPQPAPPGPAEAPRVPNALYVLPAPSAPPAPPTPRETKPQKPKSKFERFRDRKLKAKPLGSPGSSEQSADSLRRQNEQLRQIVLRQEALLRQALGGQGLAEAAKPRSALQPAPQRGGAGGPPENAPRPRAAQCRPQQAAHYDSATQRLPVYDRLANPAFFTGAYRENYRNRRPAELSNSYELVNSLRPEMHAEAKRSASHSLRSSSLGGRRSRSQDGEGGRYQPISQKYNRITPSGQLYQKSSMDPNVYERLSSPRYYTGQCAANQQQRAGGPHSERQRSAARSVSSSDTHRRNRPFELAGKKIKGYNDNTIEYPLLTQKTMNTSTGFNEKNDRFDKMYSGDTFLPNSCRNMNNEQIAMFTYLYSLNK